MTQQINALRVIILMIIVALAVVRIANMPRKSNELEAWAFICLAIGCFWRLLIHEHTPPFFEEPGADEGASGVLISLGVLFLCVNALYGEFRKSLNVPDRRRCDPQQLQHDEIRYGGTE